MADQAEARSQNAARITERAAKDPAFRRDLLADPKGVLARELAVTLPDFLEVQVVEETPTKVFLVLPATPVAAGAELSDAQLEAVAGGWSAATECGSCQVSCSNCDCHVDG